MNAPSLGKLDATVRDMPTIADHNDSRHHCPCHASRSTAP